MLLDSLIQVFTPDAVQTRHKLHQIPELKYEEQKTAAFIAEKLQGFGYQPQTGIAKTGVIVLLDTGRPGPTIGLRADMDALPIDERNDVPYRSTHPGNMHACGHDGHVATLLLVARILQELKAQLRGQVKLLFQPAEEGGKGSSAMIQAGVLENPDVEMIFGYHNWPGLPLGAVATRPGPILAGSGRIDIEIATPEGAQNPLTIAAEIITQLKTFIKIISFDRGDAKTGISKRATLVGIYHFESDDAPLKQKVETICRNLGQGAKIETTFTIFHSPTINTPSETEVVKKAGKNVIELPNCMMAAEDFSEYLKHIPGCYFLVGAGETAPQVHTAEFDFQDAIIPVAASAFCQIVLNTLKD